MNQKLNISYLGKRDYIDVSTLSSALYEALPLITENGKIKNLKIRLIKKVENECFLQLFKDSDNSTPKNIPGTAVIFNWDFEGVNYTAFFVEGEKTLNSRIKEIVDDPQEHIRYENGVVTIFNPINDDCIYNLMKMGRLIVVNKYNLYPRVVRFHFDRLFNKQEMKNIVMKAEVFSATKNFYKLETFKDGIKFGEIIIKGLDPY